jgi:hypothetical protein
MNLRNLAIVSDMMLFLVTLAPAKIVFQSFRDGNSEIYVMNDLSIFNPRP